MTDPSLLRMHPSARPTKVNFWWLSSNPFYDNPFKNGRIFQKSASLSSETSSDSYDRDLVKPDSLGEVIIKPTKFQLVLDMIHFEMHEITIRAVHNGFYVAAAHKEMVDGREYVTRHFYREYILPHDIDPSQTRSWMTTDNILYIEAPKVEFEPVALEDIEDESNIKEIDIIKMA